MIYNETATSLVIWQNFDYPTDTALPNESKTWARQNAGLNQILTSDDKGGLTFFN